MSILSHSGKGAFNVEIVISGQQTKVAFIVEI